MSGIAALAVAYVFSQFYRAFLAVLAPALTSELGATKADLALASGVWFAAFALMQFVVGIGLDRHGPRRTAGLLFGVAGAGGATLLAFARTPADVVVAMALLGIGSSPVLMAPIYLFARQFDATRLAVLSSSLVAFGNLGNVVGAAPFAAASEAFGWRTVLLALANLLVAAAVLRWVRDPARDRDARGLTLWMALAMVAGSLLYGPLDRWLGTRKWVIEGGNAIVLGALLALALDPAPSLPVATGLLLVIGVAGMSYAVTLAHGRAFLPAALVGRGVTLLNFFSIAGVGLLQFASGQLVTRQADPGDASSYRLLFGLYAVSLALALAAYLLARDAPPGSVPRGRRPDPRSGGGVVADGDSTMERLDHQFPVPARPERRRIR